MEWSYVRSDDGFQNIMWGIIIPLLVNGVMAFALNFTNFVTTKKTSALTVTVSGNVKHIVTIILSMIIFDYQITMLNALVRSSL